MNWPALHAVVWLSILTLASSQSCNTDQNPYCKGNSQFEQLCCPYPDVCYWADRAGTPACCPAGQSCQAAGGVITAPNPTTVYTTYIQQTTATQLALSTVTSYVVQPTTVTGGGVVVVTVPASNVFTSVESTIVGVVSTVTSDVAGAWSTVTSNAAGVYTTVTSDIVGGFSTVTSVVGGAASTIVQVFTSPNEAEQIQPSTIALAVALGAAIWQFV